MIDEYKELHLVLEEKTINILLNASLLPFIVICLFCCTRHMLADVTIEVMMNHGDQFEWKAPPYEYEFERPPIDLIIGDRDIRQRLENLEPVESIEAAWQEGLNRFKTISRKFHLYA